MLILILLMLFSYVHTFMQMSEKQQHQLSHLILQETQGDSTFQASDAKPITNIDYILSGYNLFTGNPATWTQTTDPGFMGRHIFSATFANKQITSDGRYKIPDHLNVITKKGCKFYFDSHALFNVEQIQSYYSTFVGLNLISNFEVTPWAFTASQEFYYMQQAIEQKQVVYAASQAQCQIFQVTLSPELPSFSETFLEALKALPVDYEAPLYMEFLQNYGSHYLTEMTLGSRQGYIYTIEKSEVATNKEEEKKKFTEKSLGSAASITSAILRDVIDQQVLPKKQDKAEFTDISKISQETFVIEIGPQSGGKDSKLWLKESESEPVPIKWNLKSIAELVMEGKKEIGEVKDYKTIGQNLKRAFGDYCKLLSLQNQRYGSCEANKREVSQFRGDKTICLNFFGDCDWSGPNQQICGDRNPIQKIGLDLPDIKGNSIRFHSDNTLILGSVRFKRDSDLNIILKSFHESFLFLEKSEICLMNHGMLTSTEYPVYITNSVKCVVLLLWNSCEGEVHYFTAPICGNLDMGDEMFEIISQKQKCEVALLDVRYPNNLGLRICLFKSAKMEGQSACFNNDQRDAYYGQEFKSLMIEEAEVMVHRSIPGSIAIQFE